MHLVVRAMNALAIPVEGCSRFAPILYDYPNPYCILAAKYDAPEIALGDHVEKERKKKKKKKKS